MCLWRRVYFSCRHEDANVTPPRPVKPCPWAILRGSLAFPVYCPAEKRGLSVRFNFQDAVIRDRPCIPCQEMQLKRRLDEEWHAFSREFLWKSSEKEMVCYVTSRQEMFTNNHFEFWEELQALFIDKCKYEMRDKPYMYGEEYMEEPKEEDMWAGNSRS
ncbi:uncharacterized protein F4807DRAFT_437723 [Annulohypoxylon truncatum]|uniref:uncharacterized protein n=1 Tax=Annulohypoxylon truncatum TaxID=327061 RepID=UPI0020079E73|nr:uncharacterized protein F4807DRAFT_437723 [Annulohypoxylon truncatum]KAI1206935.1 hypothetical protein F4807DRAFT_437723 [Annulohypoxylon truncatum]